MGGNTSMDSGIVFPGPYVCNTFFDYDKMRTATSSTKIKIRPKKPKPKNTFELARNPLIRNNPRLQRGY